MLAVVARSFGHEREAVDQVASHCESGHEYGRAHYLERAKTARPNDGLIICADFALWVALGIDDAVAVLP